MRIRRSLIGIAFAPLLALGLIVPGAAEARSTTVPKVVVIVGPVGDVTSRYVARGQAAAEMARRYTPDVVEVLTPNATWPVVRHALQDASIVVYLGHGNGWPSRYRPALYPPTQNGLGLNPVAGLDDVAHQYFGEAYLARDVRLAPNAVVVLSHLCYASGNSEPGLPEGTLDVARQRVDNFAAGWIAAGARAVVAEAYLDPAHYVRSLLSGRGSISGAWHTSPTFHGHVLEFASDRHDGFVDLLDPVNASGPGFTRSLVVRGSVTSAEVVGSGLGSAAGGGIAVPPTPPSPTLASVGAKVDAPALSGLPLSGVKRTLTLPISLPSDAPEALVDGLELSVRWDPLDVPLRAPTDASPTDSDLGASGGADPNATPSPAATPPAPADPFALVVPEVLGDVVDPVPAKQVAHGWRIRTELPEAPGLYAVSVGLHGHDGVALDAASQALVPRLLVRVVGPHSATIVAPAQLQVSTDETFSLPVGVQNSGSAPWAAPEPAGPRPGSGLDPVGPVGVTARWLALGGATGDGQDGVFEADRTVGPGDRIDAHLTLVSPSVPGSWLLVLDVSTPETPSLVAAGSRATFVRVTVTNPPSDDSSEPARR